MENRKFFVLLIIIHVPLFVYQCFTGIDYLFDSHEYLFESNNLFSSFTAYSGDLSLPIDNDLYTKRPILYPLFLGFHFLSPYLVLFFQNVISIIGIIYLRKSLKMIGYKIEFDKYLLIMLLGSLSYFIYVNMIMSESLLAFAISFMVYYAFKFIESKEVKYLLMFSITLIIGMLIKPVFYPFSFVMLIFWLIFLKRTMTRHHIIAAMLPILFVVLISSINQNRVGVSHYSSIQRINLLYYNANYFLMNQHGLDYASNYYDSIKEIGYDMAYVEKYKIEEEAAIKIVKGNLFQYSLFHLKGSLRFFLDPGRFDIYNFFSFKTSNEEGFLEIINDDGISGVFNYLKQQNVIALLLLAISLMFNIFRLFGFVIFASSLRLQNSIQNYQKIFVVMLVLYIALATGPLGAARFAVPVVLLMNAVVVLSVSNGWGKMKKSNL